MADLEPIAGLIRELIAATQIGDEIQVELHGQQIQRILVELSEPTRLPYLIGTRSSAPPIYAAEQQGFGLKRVRDTLAKSAGE